MILQDYNYLDSIALLLALDDRPTGFAGSGASSSMGSLKVSRWIQRELAEYRWPQIRDDVALTRSRVSHQFLKTFVVQFYL